MPNEATILDTPPPEVRADLARLRQALDDAIPSKQIDRNLLIATWNLRAFSSLTRKWTASATDDPKRDLRGLLSIAEILSRFDVIAIQEVKGNLRALRDLLAKLGDDWAFLMTDVTAGAPGNSERMAYLFDRRRCELSGLAGELVVPQEWLAEIAPTALKRQFARTPYAVSFRAGERTFILVTLHVVYGDSAADRIGELSAIARWLSEWAARADEWHHDLIVLGDFNIDRKDDPAWQAFTSTGLVVPERLHAVLRSIFDAGGPPSKVKFYDQIAWFESEESNRKLSMRMTNAGSFDFLPHVYGELALTRSAVSYRISDHFPLWVEFPLRDSLG